METVLILGTATPALDRATAARGLRLTAPAATPCAVLAIDPAGCPPAALPRLVVTQSADALVAAIDQGADDAVAASAGAEEIAARLAAIVRRHRARMIRSGDLVIDPLDRRVTRGGQAVSLLPREYTLLLYFVRRQGELVTRADLHRDVFGIAFDPGTNVAAVQISRLRAKIRGGAAQLLTEKGRGYRLAPAPPGG